MSPELEARYVKAVETRDRVIAKLKAEIENRNTLTAHQEREIQTHLQQLSQLKDAQQSHQEIVESLRNELRSKPATTRVQMPPHHSTSLNGPFSTGFVFGFGFWLGALVLWLLLLFIWLAIVFLGLAASIGAGSQLGS